MPPAALLSCLLALTLCALPAHGAVPKRLTVFAAASLQESLDAAAKLWTGRSGQPVVVSYAGSSALARQIEQGAPADVFVSADREWMDHLQDRGLIDPATRTLLARNRLVLVAPSSSSAVVSLRAGELRAALGTDGRLALAETAGVPAGRYARQALQSLGLWTEVQDRLAESDNVRAALAYVARGEAPLGIVYATDARVEPKVRVLVRIPSQHHEAIVYPMARVASAEAAHADGFLRFLAGPQARAVFARAGFEAP
jgi:molybdate transport system substrate-binding protein